MADFIFTDGLSSARSRNDEEEKNYGNRSLYFHADNTLLKNRAAVTSMIERYEFMNIN